MDIIVSYNEHPNYFVFGLHVHTHISKSRTMVARGSKFVRHWLPAAVPLLAGCGFLLEVGLSKRRGSALTDSCVAA